MNLESQPRESPETRDHVPALSSDLELRKRCTCLKGHSAWRTLIFALFVLLWCLSWVNSVWLLRLWEYYQKCLAVSFRLDGQFRQGGGLITN